jgi:hypothetical protein
MWTEIRTAVLDEAIMLTDCNSNHVVPAIGVRR